MSNKHKTFFIDAHDRVSLGDAEGIIPIPLRIGMQITIHGHEGIFEVTEWSFHHGHPDEDSGLKIFLKKL